MTYFTSLAAHTIEIMTGIDVMNMFSIALKIYMLGYSYINFKPYTVFEYFIYLLRDGDN